MKRKRLLVIAAGLVVCLAYGLFTNIPYPLVRHYEGTVSGSHGTLRSLPVTVRGQVYRGIFTSDQFVGQVTIGRRTYGVSTLRQSRLSQLVSRIQNPQESPPAYPYVAILERVYHNYSVAYATIEMSGNFHSVIGSTHALTTRYGPAAGFNAQQVKDS